MDTCDIDIGSINLDVLEFWGSEAGAENSYSKSIHYGESQDD